MEVRRWRRQVQEEDESSAEKKACFVLFFFLEGGVIHVVGDRLNRNRKEKNISEHKWL